MAESYQTCFEKSLRAKEQKEIFPSSVNAEMETWGRGFPKTIQGWSAGWGQKWDCQLCIKTLLLSASVIFGVKKKLVLILTLPKI